MAEAIRQVFERNKAFKGKDVCASLSGNAVIVKKITLPVMTESELDESIYWEAEQYIPFDIQDVNLDYQILDPGTGPDSRGSMEVLLVAAKKEKIGDYTGVIAQAGRTPVIVDVDAFALQNAFDVNYGLDPAQVVVLLNAGASAININILQGEQSMFTRDISIGGNAYTEAVQKELDLPHESAEAAEEGDSGRRRVLRGGPAGAAGGHRERAARSAEDVRLLQGDRLVGSHRPHHAERRRLARGRIPRDAARALQRAGRGVRSVPRGRRGIPRSSVATLSSTRPRRRWPLASRSGKWATDDSHQPPRHRAQAEGAQGSVVRRRHSD